MSTRVFLLSASLGFLVLFLLPSGIPQPQAATKGTVYAVLIGVGQYKRFPDKRKRWTNLDYTKRDVQGLYRVLTGPGKVPPQNIKMLYDHNATKQKIIGSLGSWLKKAKPQDTVMVYFSGHGAAGGNGISYWMAHDTPQTSVTSGISQYMIDGILARLRTKRVVLLIDACQSGQGIQGTKGRAGRKGVIDPSIYRSSGRVTIASSKQNELSYESKKLKHGVFSYALMQALQGKADVDKDGVVDADEAYRYLVKHVPKLAWTLERGRQHPVRHTLSAGLFALSFPGIPKETRLPGMMRSIKALRGAKMVWIPGGAFVMGAPKADTHRWHDEYPQHNVTLSRGFWMMQTEVTQGQFQTIMGYNPSTFKKCGNNCPVENMTWHEAAHFANRLSSSSGIHQGCYTCLGEKSELRCQPIKTKQFKVCKGWKLPTEAQWERAARAESNTPLYTGTLTLQNKHKSSSLEAISWYSGNSRVHYKSKHACQRNKKQAASPAFCGSHPVRQKAPNSWRLYDMLGNVYEWTHDGYRTYIAQEEHDPIGRIIKHTRVIRGGSWGSQARYLRVTHRSVQNATVRSDFVGFRLIKTE